MLQRSFRRAGAFTVLISLIGVTSGNMSHSIAADTAGAPIMQIAYVQPAQARASLGTEPCYSGKDNVPQAFGAAGGDPARTAPEVGPIGNDSRDQATGPSAADDLLRFELEEQFLNAIRMDTGKHANHMPALNAFLHVAAIAFGNDGFGHCPGIPPGR